MSTNKVPIIPLNETKSQEQIDFELAQELQAQFDLEYNSDSSIEFVDNSIHSDFIETIQVDIDSYDEILYTDSDYDLAFNNQIRKTQLLTITNKTDRHSAEVVKKSQDIAYPDYSDEDLDEDIIFENENDDEGVFPLRYDMPSHARMVLNPQTKHRPTKLRELAVRAERILGDCKDLGTIDFSNLNVSSNVTPHFIKSLQKAKTNEKRAKIRRERASNRNTKSLLEM